MFLIQCWRIKDAKSWEIFLTDKVIKHRRPDIVCIDNITRTCLNHCYRHARRPVYHYGRTKKDSQVPRFVNIIEENMKIKG